MKLTKQINIGGVPVGGAPIAIQSMTNTDTRDAKRRSHRSVRSRRQAATS